MQLLCTRTFIETKVSSILEVFQFLSELTVTPIVWTSVNENENEHVIE